jgi:hypothetical protein
MEAIMVAGSAATAAAIAARRARYEEEEMTPYGSRDLAEGWEFKILRSVSGGFRNPMWLKSVLDEESRAGWSFLEKFDDYRVRLKRPVGANERNAAPVVFDPYRTWVGISPIRYTLWVVGIVLLVTIVFIVLLIASLAHFGLVR